MRTELFAALAFAAATGLAAPVPAQDLAIATGSATGTYIEFGRDIAEAARKDGLTVSVRESTGSMMNAFAVRYTPGVQLGIVQSDLRGFLRDRAEGFVDAGLSEDERLALSEMVEKIQLVYPLYIEEVHILARDDIRSLSDLSGKIVSVGQAGSGTFITAEQLFRRAGIAIDAEQSAPETALRDLRDGYIDAMVYVVGQPAAFFQDGVGAGDGLHLVPVDDPALLEVYDSARIEPSSYAWLPAAVSTVGVRSLLVAYAYEGENCGLIGRLSAAIAADIDRLRREGHPKWAGVALDARVADWEPYACAAGIAEAAPAETPAVDSATGLPDFLSGFD